MIPSVLDSRHLGFYCFELTKSSDCSSRQNYCTIWTLNGAFWLFKKITEPGFSALTNLTDFSRQLTNLTNLSNFFHALWSDQAYTSKFFADLGKGCSTRYSRASRAQTLVPQKSFWTDGHFYKTKQPQSLFKAILAVPASSETTFQTILNARFARFFSIF